jgi:hypothetical protein
MIIFIHFLGEALLASFGNLKAKYAQNGEKKTSFYKGVLGFSCSNHQKIGIIKIRGRAEEHRGGKMAPTAAMGGDGEKRSNIKTIKQKGESLESEKRN